MAKRISEAEHVARMVLYRAGWSDAQIAHRQGVPPGNIVGWRRKHGLLCNGRKRRCIGCDEVFVIFGFNAGGRRLCDQCRKAIASKPRASMAHATRR